MSASVSSCRECVICSVPTTVVVFGSNGNSWVASGGRAAALGGAGGGTGGSSGWKTLQPAKVSSTPARTARPLRRIGRSRSTIDFDFMCMAPRRPRRSQQSRPVRQFILVAPARQRWKMHRDQSADLPHALDRRRTVVSGGEVPFHGVADLGPLVGRDAEVITPVGDDFDVPVRK